jgi:hypothetical protein
LTKTNFTVKENPLKMSKFLRNKYFFNEKSPKKAIISQKQYNINDLEKIRFLIKSPKKAFTSHSHVNKKKSTHLAKIYFTVKLHFVKGKFPQNV